MEAPAPFVPFRFRYIFQVYLRASKAPRHRRQTAMTTALLPRRLTLALLLAPSLLTGCGEPPAAGPATAQAVKPALSVQAIRPRTADWPRSLAANGDIAAWQETVIGAELGGYRILAVRVNVGDRVRRGEELARLDAATVAAELAESRAAVAEAEAAVAEAVANAERARRLQAEGFYSAQMGNQYLTGEQTARARLEAARARARADEIRLGQSRVLAPDDGVISARAATVGSLAQAGQELFRLIRGGRLEWRGRVPEAEIGRMATGTPVRLTLPDGSQARGRVRALGPAVDTATRDGLVYVDLEAAAGARAGMFARGEFDLGRAPALTLPQAALLLRDGYTYAFRLEGGGQDGLAKVAQTKVEVGRRLADRVEVLAGLPPDAQVVASGVGFLADGDVVRVVPGK